MENSKFPHTGGWPGPRKGSPSRRAPDEGHRSDSRLQIIQYTSEVWEGGMGHLPHCPSGSGFTTTASNGFRAARASLEEHPRPVFRVRSERGIVGRHTRKLSHGRRKPSAEEHGNVQNRDGGAPGSSSPVCESTTNFQFERLRKNVGHD
jgi:hypothetical protein